MSAPSPPAFQADIQSLTCYAFSFYCIIVLNFGNWDMTLQANALISGAEENMVIIENATNRFLQKIKKAASSKGRTVFVDFTDFCC